MFIYTKWYVDNKGGLLAQFNGANEDHCAVYMQSNPQLYDQQL